jgi:opacity protein-like surface antigen
MKKLSFLASLLVLCLPLAASAQEVAPKVEIFGGYSFLRVDLGAVPAGTVPAGTIPGNLDTHGFNVSFAGNVARHVGIISEFSHYTKTESFNILGSPIPGGVNAKFRVLTLLFGPRVTLHRGKVEPFVHGLFGAARATTEAPDLGVSAGDAAYAFAYALGGGVEGFDNFRYSVGVVIRLGNR